MLPLKYILINPLQEKLKKVLLRSLIITLIIQLSGLFSLVPLVHDTFDISRVEALSPGLPIYSVFRDANWWENISATAQTLSWDTEVSESVNIPIVSGDTNFDLSDGWHYLVMYSVPIRSTGGSNRSEVQTWLRVNSSSAVPYSYGSSYIRRTDDDFEWYNEWAAVIDVAAGDEVELRIQKTDSNTATMQRTPGRSGINILKLDDAWDYARVRPSWAQAIETIWEDVDIWLNDELDTWSILWPIASERLLQDQTGRIMKRDLLLMGAKLMPQELLHMWGLKTVHLPGLPPMFESLKLLQQTKF